MPKSKNSLPDGLVFIYFYFLCCYFASLCRYLSVNAVLLRILDVRSTDRFRFHFRWLNYTPIGNPIAGTPLIACKVPLRKVRNIPPYLITYPYRYFDSDTDSESRNLEFRRYAGNVSRERPRKREENRREAFERDSSRVENSRCVLRVGLKGIFEGNISDGSRWFHK